MCKVNLITLDKMNIRLPYVYGYYFLDDPMSYFYHSTQGIWELFYHLFYEQAIKMLYWSGYLVQSSINAI